MTGKNGAKAPYNPFNRPKFAAQERLVCSYLIESLTAPSMQAVIFICRAALLLSKPEIDKLDLDMEAINSVYTVAERLESARIGDEGTHPVHLSSLDFEKEIKPWARCKVYRYWAHGTDEHELAKMSHRDSLYTVLNRLSPAGYRALASDFLQMATPFAQSLGGILTGLISPETYTDMLQTYKGVKT